MGRGKRQAGVTLLETLVASGIFALLIGMVMGMFARLVTSSEMDILQTQVENQVQDAVDDVVRDIKETAPILYSSYDFTEGGYTQSALCFPTARDKAKAQFTYKIGTVVQSQPVWQAMEVVCYVKNPNSTDGWLYKYTDYNAHSYVNPIKVSSVTTSQITLSDGTKFSRLGTLSANQKRVQIQGRFIQVMTQGTSPVQLTVRSACKEKVIRGGLLITTLTNEALSRNHN